MKLFDKISERLETTIANIEFQKGRVLWDDLEKLEEVLQRVKELEKGVTLSQDEFRDGIGNTAFQLVEEGGGSAKLGEYVEEGIQNYVDKF